VREDGKIFLIECNPNPDLGRYEDYAESALSMGIQYEDLIARVVTLGLRSPPVRPLPT
jgi:D-alanine-D-alanine ligase